MFNHVLDLCGYLAILYQNLDYSRDGSAGSDDAETESSDGKPEDAEERKRRRRQYNPLPDYTERSKKDIRDGKMPLKLLSPRYLAKVCRKVNMAADVAIVVLPVIMRMVCLTWNKTDPLSHGQRSEHDKSVKQYCIYISGGDSRSVLVSPGKYLTEIAKMQPHLIRQLTAWICNLLPFATLAIDSVYHTQAMCSTLKALARDASGLGLPPSLISRTVNESKSTSTVNFEQSRDGGGIQTTVAPNFCQGVTMWNISALERLNGAVSLPVMLDIQYCPHGRLYSR